MTDSPHIAPVYPGDFSEIRGLLQELDPTLSTERWRAIFDYPWRRAEEPVGYVLRDGGRAVGYMGTILSEMMVDGRLERFCNVTSWVSRDTHRGGGALLALQLHRLSGYTITNLSSSTDALPIFQRLGFTPLDTHWTVLRPTPSLLGMNRRGMRCQILTEPKEIAVLLDGHHSQIFEDHLAYALHVLMETEIGQCYAVYTVRPRWRLRAVRFHYVSDKDIFRRCWPWLHRNLLVRHGTVLGEIDSRLLRDVTIPGSMQKQMGLPRLYKSSHLRPEQISDLYSEIILLKVR